MTLINGVKPRIFRLIIERASPLALPDVVYGVQWPNGQVTTQRQAIEAIRSNYDSVEQVEHDWQDGDTRVRLEWFDEKPLFDDLLPVPRPLRMVRHEDVTEVSGTGVVLLGVQWPNGAVDTQWQGPISSRTTWTNVEQVRAVHGHDGLSVIEFYDELEEASAQ